MGYYADINGDKIVDGIIYADLAVGGSGTWNGNSWSSYEYTKVAEGLKSYYVSSDSYTGFGGQWTQPVLTAVNGTMGKDRFYVMAIEDFSPETKYCWYDAAYTYVGNPIENEVNDFGQGKNNTITMRAKWNNSEYGPQDDNGTYKDMWGAIQKTTDDVGKKWDLNTWFVPSKAEWAAFGDMTHTKMGVTTNNYVDYELKEWYWSSAQGYPFYAYGGSFKYCYVDGNSVNLNNYVRLSAIF